MSRVDTGKEIGTMEKQIEVGMASRAQSVGFVYFLRARGKGFDAFVRQDGKTVSFWATEQAARQLTDEFVRDWARREE